MAVTTPSGAPAPPKHLRLFRYGAVSIVTAGVAQAALAIGYGFLRWGTTPAVALSLLASVGPAYLLNSRYVWAERLAERRRIVSFVVLAAAGSVVAAVATYGAEHVARGITADHTVLTV